jgi:dipeptidyl aminopeptidase/acylaminoacyl peptidase
LFWVNPERVVVEVSFTHVGDKATNDPRYTQEIYRAISVDTRCENAVDLLKDIKNIGRVTGGEFLGRTADSKRVLFSALNLNERATAIDTHGRGISTDSLDVYAIDPATGKNEKYETGSNKTIEWIAASAGRLRLRIDKKAERGDAYVVMARVGESNDWQPVYDSTLVNDKSRVMHFLGVASTTDTAYVATRNGGDTLGVFEFDLKNKTLGRKLMQDGRVDAGGLIVGDVSGTAVGFNYVQDVPTDHYFDADYAQMQADLAATFPGESVAIRSVSNDRKKFVAYVEGAQNPGGVYHFVDMSVPEMSKIGARYSALSAADIAPVKSFTYQARDGLAIPAYLTLPPGSAGKNLPLVVHPHGGPASRDNAAFDAWAQFFATRGYAVLQPQFRGSSGFGSRHREAGAYKWGLEMQDDITDGVKHLIANGTVDASKVCIFGWSYGGYASLAGLAFTPDLYKCGASGAGPSDLQLLAGDAARGSELVYLAGDSWRDFVGDPTKDRARLIATSPAKHADKIKAPLLLIHGRMDTVVPIRQSEVMAGAMKAAGKPVEFITIDGDDHWISLASSNKRLLQELDRFLAKHLK